MAADQGFARWLELGEDLRRRRGTSISWQRRERGHGQPLRGRPGQERARAHAGLLRLSLITAISNDIGYDQVFALPSSDAHRRRHAGGHQQLRSLPSVLAGRGGPRARVDRGELSAMTADNPLRTRGA